MGLVRLGPLALLVCCFMLAPLLGRSLDDV
jgi:hypothetical protein